VVILGVSCGLVDGGRPCTRVPFARWHYDDTAYVVTLCQHHLDLWLDNADAEPQLEPTRLVFLPGP
jgi:hypothetical protein